MKTSLERWLFGALLLVILVMGATNIYIADVNQRQAHTIRQLMGWENGPDATPRPLPMPQAAPSTSAPEPQDHSTFDRKRQSRTI